MARCFGLKKNKLALIVSGKKSKDVVYIHQDATFLLGDFEENKTANCKLNNSKHGIFVFVIEGGIEIENNKLEKGDSAEMTETDNLKFKTIKESKFLVIEVPLN